MPNKIICPFCSVKCYNAGYNFNYDCRNINCHYNYIFYTEPAAFIAYRKEHWDFYVGEYFVSVNKLYDETAISVIYYVRKTGQFPLKLMEVSVALMPDCSVEKIKTYITFS